MKSVGWLLCSLANGPAKAHPNGVSYMALSLDDVAAMIRDIPCVTLEVDEGSWSIQTAFSEQPMIAVKQIRLVQKQLRGVKKAVNGSS